MNSLGALMLALGDPPPERKKATLGPLLMQRDATQTHAGVPVLDEIRAQGTGTVRELPQQNFIKKILGVPDRLPRESKLGAALKAIGANDPLSMIDGGPLKAATVAARVGKIANKAEEAKPFIRAYHGSPHDFDKFDLSKIGTGEGAQAYGHGLYFAEAEDVAKSYKTVHEPAYRNAGVHAIVTDAMKAAEAAGLQGNEARKFARSEINRQAMDRPSYARQQWFDASNNLDSVLDEPTGKMYEVAINADPGDFLDWDAPITRQPERVQETLAKAGVPVRDASGMFGIEKTPSGKSFKVVANGYEFGTYRSEDAARKRVEQLVGAYTQTGGLAYKDLARQIGDDAAASRALREAGVPGVRYFDAGSRDAAAGTRNFVAFDDSLVEILRKYGLAGLLASPALAARSQGQQ